MLLGIVPAWAQEVEQQVLLPQEAIMRAVEQNFGRKVSSQNEAISRRAYEWGWAEFLPTVSATAAKNWSVSDENIDINAGENVISVNRAGARSDNLAAGVTASWVVFDGLGMFHTYELVRLRYEASRQFDQQTINELAADVLSIYFLHTLQQQRLELWRTTLELSEQRLRLAKDRYEVGKTSKQEYLAALVDYNADRAALLAQQEALQNTKHQFNRLLGQNPRDPLVTVDTLLADSSLIQELLQPQPLVGNPSLRAAELQIAAANKFVDEQRSQYWPVIRLNSGYNFTRVNNQVGNLLFREAQGFNYGISANWSLFNGFIARRNVQIARLQSRIAELNLQQLELDLLTSQADALVSYRNQWQQIALEEENLEYARQSAAIALDRYKLGVITPLELRAAQQNAQQAALRLLNAVYELKLAETELMRVSGQLVSGF